MTAGPAPATSAADAARIDLVWGDPETWQDGGRNWCALQAVRRAVNRRVSGDPERPPVRWFFERVARCRPLPLDRALVLGCGGGRLERDIVRAGWVREVVAVDLSPRALAAADAAARREGLTGIRYRAGDMNDLAVDGGPFDAVFGVSAVHHCANLEALFARIAGILRPDGWLFLDEFIGPARFQWPDRQLRQLDRLLTLLPERLQRTGSGRLRHRYERLSVAEMIAADPSEAVRSNEIPALVADRFTVVERRGYGGALLHLVLANVAQNFESGDGPLYLDLLIAAEARLQQAGLLEDNFAVMIARPRG